MEVDRKRGGQKKVRKTMKHHQRELFQKYHDAGVADVSLVEGGGEVINSTTKLQEQA